MSIINQLNRIDMEMFMYVVVVVAVAFFGQTMH